MKPSIRKRLVLLSVILVISPNMAWPAAKCLVAKVTQTWDWDQTKEETDPTNGYTKRAERHHATMALEGLFDLEEPDTISADYVTRSWKVTSFEGLRNFDSYHKGTSCANEKVSRTDRSILANVMAEDTGYGEAGYLQVEFKGKKKRPWRVLLPLFGGLQTWQMNSREENTRCDGHVDTYENSQEGTEVFSISAIDPNQEMVANRDGVRLEGGGTKTWTDEYGVNFRNTFQWTLDNAAAADCDYDTVWQTFMSRMAFLRAYAAKGPARKTLNKDTYEWLVGILAEKIYKKYVKTMPGRPPVVVVASDLDMGTCEITPPQGDRCQVVLDSIMAHENTHQARCIALNQCAVDPNNPLKPTACQDPDAYTRWDEEIPVKQHQKDEVESMCNSVKPLVEWLENYRRCGDPQDPNSKKRRDRLNEQKKYIRKICQ